MLWGLGIGESKVVGCRCWRGIRAQLVLSIDSQTRRGGRGGWRCHGMICMSEY